MTQHDNKDTSPGPRKVRVQVTIPHLHQHLILSVSVEATVQELLERISAKKQFAIFDARGLRSYTYSLRRRAAPDADLSLHASLEALNVQDDEQFLLVQSGRELQISNERRGLAVFEVDDSWSVLGIQDLLSAIRDAYVALFALNQILTDPNSSRAHYRATSLHEAHNRIATHLRTDEDLLLRSISINSPGIIEIIGALNPLETIRRFLEDHRRAKAQREEARLERAKDKSYRGAFERDKVLLELESLKTKVADERGKMLRDLGYSEEEIRPFIEQILTPSLIRLQVHQENHKLDCKRVLPIETIEIDVVFDESYSPDAPQLPPAPTQAG